MNVNINKLRASMIDDVNNDRDDDGKYACDYDGDAAIKSIIDAPDVPCLMYIARDVLLWDHEAACLALCQLEGIDYHVDQTPRRDDIVRFVASYHFD